MRHAKVAINRRTRKRQTPQQARIDERQERKRERGDSNERSCDVPFKPIILCMQTHARAAFHQ